VNDDVAGNIWQAPPRASLRGLDVPSRLRRTSLRRRQLPIEPPVAVLSRDERSVLAVPVGRRPRCRLQPGP